MRCHKGQILAVFAIETPPGFACSQPCPLETFQPHLAQVDPGRGGLEASVAQVLLRKKLLGFAATLPPSYAPSWAKALSFPSGSIPQPQTSHCSPNEPRLFASSQEPCPNLLYPCHSQGPS